ncbi:hypothetical protein SAMN02745194_03626 [Roseomonas rosea]|uniref:Uncharacterized protein n=1 Tax=Muricoccus roseus TaxID=198092 RepID=A0A1M6MWT6_9PROT|nr:hypothetical protein SAMN02745194_03626 [Roseomonas rosea]
MAPRDEAADDPEAEHEGQHLRPPRRPVAEVGAVGDDMHLRHRHRHAAGQAGQHQQRLQRALGNTQPRQPARRLRPAPGGLHGRRPPQGERQRQHGHHAEQPDADMRRPPAVGGDEMLQDRRPDGAGEVVPAGAERHRDAPPPVEPEGGVRHQRPEHRAAPQPADEHGIEQSELPQLPHEGGGDIARAQRERADHHRQHDAEPVRQPPHGHAADHEGQHGHRVGQRRPGPVHAEFRLHGGKRHHDGPEPDPADGRQQHRRDQPPPGIGGFRSALLGHLFASSPRHRAA